MTADRLHGLRLPDCTSCGREGRLISLGDTSALALVQGDRLYRIAQSSDAIDCSLCLARIGRHGWSFAWAGIPPHSDSIAPHKARRRRRRALQ